MFSQSWQIVPIPPIVAKQSRVKPDRFLFEEEQQPITAEEQLRFKEQQPAELES